MPYGSRYREGDSPARRAAHGSLVTSGDGCYFRLIESVSSPAVAGRHHETPGWWPVISGVFLGYLCALLVLGVIGLVLDILGVVTWPRGSDGEGWLGGPFEPDGPWSVFSDALLAFTVLAVTSFMVASQLSDRIQLRVSWLVTFAVLCVTGYVPFFFFEGRLRLSGLLGLLLSAALIRWFGIEGTQPADFLANGSRRLLADPRRRRRLVFAVAVGWAAALGAGVAYGVTHPVRVSGGSAYGPAVTIDGRDYSLYRGEPGKTRVVSVFLHNNGFADVADATVSLPPEETLPVRRVGSEMLPPNPGFLRTVASPFPIPGRNEAGVGLAFRIPRCAEGVQTLSRVKLSYSIFGREESQLIRLDPAIAAQCHENAG
jgi:hypothetical protein